MIGATLILACAVVAASPNKVHLMPRGFAELSVAGDFRYTGGSYNDELFRYRLFVPRNRKSGERYPLLVWLHGCAEGGNDNENNLKHLDMILDDPNHIEKYRFFILAVQCQSKETSWPGGYGEHDMLTVTHAVLQKTIQEQPVDVDRVYLAGVSGGGSGSWEMAMRYPGLFAAVAPMASRGGDASRVANLIDVPIWAFHNLHDSGSPPKAVEEMATAVSQAGGNVFLTIEPAIGHDCWSSAFRQHHIMEWMLAQHRGAWICWTPPGCHVWQWWHILTVPIASAILVGWGWYSERKRRGAKRRSSVPPESAATPTG